MQTLVIVAGALTATAVALRAVGAHTAVSVPAKRSLRVVNVIVGVAGALVATVAGLTAVKIADTSAIATTAGMAMLLIAGAVLATVPYGPDAPASKGTGTRAAREPSTGGSPCGSAALFADSTTTAAVTSTVAAAAAASGNVC